MAYDPMYEAQIAELNEKVERLERAVVAQQQSLTATIMGSKLTLSAVENLSLLVGQISAKVLP